MAVQYDHDHENDKIYFGRVNYRNAMIKFGIKTDDRRRHMYVIGKTGMGKTTLLENMILSDIYLGHGCCYVDPHGDTAEKLVNYIPEWRKKDVVYFNPSDTSYPMGFNILEAIDESKRHVVGSGLMGVFMKIWPDVWSARMEHIMNNSILTLLENPGNTLLGINRLLVDKDFRRKMIAGVSDPVVKSFWLTEFEQWDNKYRTEAIAPIQNKVSQFLSTALVRNIVAQPKSSINPRIFMDESKIFIVNLSKGRIGEDSMRLLGGMLITKLQLSAMERVDIPEDERRDFYLYIDEFQNFATDSFANILSEARKYRLALIMAHQYIEQLEETVRAAVFGNVGTICTFRVGSPDAVFLEREFLPRFTQEDLVNLAKFEIYLRLMIDGVASEPFSANTLPPIATCTNSAESAIDQSRKEYAVPRAQVEAAVLKWSGLDEEEKDGDMTETFAKLDKDVKERKKEARRPKFEYDCTKCKKHMTLPVELDASRPIYCEDCIEIVREERKKGRGGDKGGWKSPPKKAGDSKGSPSSSGSRDKSGSAGKPPKAPAPPSIKDGALVTKKAEGSMSLSALSKKPEEKREISDEHKSGGAGSGSAGKEEKRPERKDEPKPERSNDQKKNDYDKRNSERNSGGRNDGQKKQDSGSQKPHNQNSPKKDDSSRPKQESQNRDRKPEQKSEQRPERKVEQKSESKLERKPEPKPEPKQDKPKPQQAVNPASSDDVFPW